MEIKGIEEIKFDSNGLVPAIAQDANTGEVLMMAYMNMEAVEKTLSTGKAHYYSRSRKALWLKGETSGNFQTVLGVRYDCDGDTLLLLVEPAGPACHTGNRTCFYRTLGEVFRERGAGPMILSGLFNILKERKSAPPGKSYVSSLYERGLTKILEKVKEESAEFIEAAEKKGDKEIIHELTDLWFHTLVLLSYKGIGIEDLFAEFRRRFGTSGIDEKRARGKKED